MTTGAVTGGSTIGPSGAVWLILSANVTSSTFTFTAGKDYTVCAVQPASGGPYTFAAPTNITGWPALINQAASGFTCLKGNYNSTFGSLVASAYTNGYSNCSTTTAPSAPASGSLTPWCDSTTGRPMSISSVGTFGQVQDIAAVTNKFVTSVVNGIPILAQPTPTNVGLSAVTNDAQTKAAIVPNTAPSAG